MFIDVVFTYSQVKKTGILEYKWLAAKINGIGAPAGIWTRVADSKGQYTWPDYTTGALSQ